MKLSSSRGLMVAIIGTSTSIPRSSRAQTRVLRGKALMGRHRTITSIFRNNWTGCIKGGKTRQREEYSSLTNNIQAIWRICHRSSKMKWWSLTFRTCTITLISTTPLTRTLKMPRAWKRRQARTMSWPIISRWTRMASRTMEQSRTRLRTTTGKPKACSIGMLSVLPEHTRTRRCSKWS